MREAEACLLPEVGGMFFELQQCLQCTLGLGLFWGALGVCCLLLCSSPPPHQPFPAISSLFFIPHSCSCLTNLCKREGWDVQCQN